MRVNVVNFSGVVGSGTLAQGHLRGGVEWVKKVNHLWEKEVETMFDWREGLRFKFVANT